MGTWYWLLTTSKRRNTSDRYHELRVPCQHHQKVEKSRFPTKVQPRISTSNAKKKNSGRRKRKSWRLLQSKSPLFTINLSLDFSTKVVFLENIILWTLKVFYSRVPLNVFLKSHQWNHDERYTMFYSPLSKKVLLKKLLLIGNKGMRYSGEGILTAKKFKFNAVNLLLRRFSQIHHRQAAGCKKLSRKNLQEMWPRWKIAFQTVGKWKWLQ